MAIAERPEAEIVDKIGVEICRVATNILNARDVAEPIPSMVLAAGFVHALRMISKNGHPEVEAAVKGALK
jgi:hypothetical protein